MFSFLKKLQRYKTNKFHTRDGGAPDAPSNEPPLRGPDPILGSELSPRGPDLVLETQSSLRTEGHIFENQFIPKDNLIPRKGPHGLFVLYPKEGVENEANVDIVAVHGLAGDAWSTWKDPKSGSIWLEDFLPAALPNSRIMTFGYDSATILSKSVSNIGNFATQLLNSLNLLRKDLPGPVVDRPIIFICHSLGGIVVKKALIKANENTRAYGEILSSCRGIMFMGTPHKGSNLAVWGATLKRIAQTAMFSQMFRTNLVRDLTYSSDVLGDISRQFVQRSGPLKIKTFIEQNATRPLTTLVSILMGLDSGVVADMEFSVLKTVPEESATMGLPNETLIPMNTDHNSICRFPRATDKNYLLVQGAIMDLARGDPQVGGSRNSLSNHFKTPLRLPYFRNQRFSGRGRLLERLHTALGFIPGYTLPINSRLRIAVLHGLGGIGKSQISIEYAYRYSEFYSSIFWVDASSQGALFHSALKIVQILISHYKGNDATPDFLKIGAMLCLPSGFIGVDGQVNQKGISGWRLLEAMREWLSIEGNNKWLVIFDNYDDLDSVKLGDFVPHVGFGSVIITTRKRDAQYLGYGIEVGEIEREAGISILLRSAALDPGRLGAIESIEAGRIVDKLGYLPLALDQAGGYISAMGIPLSGYLPRYAAKFGVVTAANRPALEANYRNNILYTTWKISFDSLPPVAQHLLTLCSFLGTHDIVQELIEKGKEELEWLKEVDLEEKGLKYIFSFSLAKRTTSGSSISFHPLVLEWARHQSLEKNQEKIYAKEALFVIGRAIRYEVKLSWHWAFQREVYIHIDFSIGNLQKYVSPEEDQWDPKTSSVVSQIAMVYVDMKELNTAQELLKQVWKSYAKMCQNVDELDMLDTMHRIGVVSNSKGEYEEALRWYKPALAGKEKILGKEHLKTLNTVHNIAVVLDDQGEYEEALEWYRRALAGFEKLLGEEHPNTLDTVHNIGAIFDAQEEYEKALEWYERALTGFEKSLGSEHPTTLLTIHNIGSIFSCQEEYEKALEWYGRALAGFENSMGREHTSTLDTVYNIAEVFQKQGEYEKALKWYGRALAGFERGLGSGHPSTNDTVYNIAGVLQSQGKFEKAIEWYKRALVGREKLLGKGHSSTLDVVNTIGAIFEGQGEYETALEWYGQALVSCENTLGSEHPITLYTIHNMADVFQKQGEYAKALEWYWRVLVGCKKVLKNEHPRTLETIHNIADVFQKEGKYEKALEWYQRALVGREKVLGREHHRTLETIHNMAGVFQKQGEYGEAVVWYKRAVRGLEKTLGKEHERTVEAAKGLAQAQRKLQ